MDEGKTLTRGQARRQAMLDAATELFLEKGFERTSLSDIVARSKGSRSTLYEQFGNKEGLLHAMVEEAVEWFRQETRWNADAALSTEEALTEAGIRFLRTVSSPRSAAIYRILVAEGQRLPEIARLFFDICPAAIRDRATELIRAAQDRQRLGPGCPADMARVLIGAILGDFYIQRSLGLETDWTDAEIEAYARTAVQIFLNGVTRR